MEPSADLVERARSGDRAAFEALYDATSPALFLYVVGILGHREDAEDALHAAYLAAWQRLPNLRRPERFAPWLFRIGRNAARDIVRRERHGAPLPASLEARSPDDAEALDPLLQGLRPETRALLLLRHGLEWSAAQIAVVLATSAPTVRRHLARAHAHLRRLHEARLIHDR